MEPSLIFQWDIIIIYKAKSFWLLRYVVRSVNSMNMNSLYFFCYKMNSFIKSNVIINKMIKMVYKAFIKSKYS